MKISTAKLDAILDKAEEEGAEIYTAFYRETDAPPSFWIIVYLGGIGDDDDIISGIPALDELAEEAAKSPTPPLVNVEYLRTHYRIYVPRTWETHYMRFPTWTDPEIYL